MHQYRVVERWTKEDLCALRCGTGRYHVARALKVVPPMEGVLVGDKPRLGFGILRCASSGAIFRVIFESINDPQLRFAPGPLPSEPAGTNGGVATLPV
jgi:hypothetical protein